MNLEHDQLAPFEPILESLYPQVFEAGIAALQKAGLIGDIKELLPAIDSSGSGFRKFIRGCHYGWDLAQRKLSELVIDYYEEVHKLKQALKVDFRDRNREEIEEKRALIECLELRQIVLRRLIDTILYQQLKMQTWILRRVMMEYRIRDIDPVTLRKTVQSASDLNREERLNFHLVSDLTTVVHVGDLV